MWEKKQNDEDIKQLTQGHLNLLEKPKIKPMCCASHVLAHAERKCLPWKAVPEEIWHMQRLHLRNLVKKKSTVPSTGTATMQHPASNEGEQQREEPPGCLTKLKRIITTKGSLCTYSSFLYSLKPIVTLQS